MAKLTKSKAPEISPALLDDLRGFASSLRVIADMAKFVAAKRYFAEDYLSENRATEGGAMRVPDDVSVEEFMETATKIAEDLTQKGTFLHGFVEEIFQNGTIVL